MKYNDRSSSHRWSRNPQPQPQTFSKPVFLVELSLSYICLGWLSGALVGVLGSDFIGQGDDGAGRRVRKPAEVPGQFSINGNYWAG